MIDKVVSWVVQQLGSQIFLQTQGRDRVTAASLYDLEGKIDPRLFDKLVVSVVNLTEERTYRSTRIHERRPEGLHERVHPPVHVNLHLLFIAFMSSYDEAIKALGQVLTFFQQNPGVPFASVPGLETLEGRLSFELQSPSFEQVNHMWGSLGAKYMPSALYKVGIVAVRDRKVEAEVQPVRELWTNPETVGG